MAPFTSKLYVNRLNVVILIYLEVIRRWHVCGSHDVSAEYVFTPNDVLQIVETSCFIGISSYSLQFSEHDELLKVYSGLQAAYALEDKVILGLIEEEFVWPSGNALQYEFALGDDIYKNVTLFSKRKTDRTCLSTRSLRKKEPAAVIYNGILKIEIVVEFINQKCDTFRTKTGYLSTEGLHRQEILNSLFHVQNVSDVDMEYLLNQHSSLYCTQESCKKKLNSKENRVSESRPLNFRDLELNIQKCEEVSVPSKGEFFHKYLKLSKPVVFKNAANLWPAMKKWTNEYMMKNHGNNAVHIKLTPLGEFEGVDSASNFENYNDFQIPKDVKEQLLFPDLVVVRPATANVKFSKFLDLVDSVANGTRVGFSSYLEYSSIADVIPELKEDVSEMPFFEKVLQLKHLNIWLSDGNTLGKLHFDPFDNALCQLSGRKQVILFDPHDNTRHYEAHIPEASLSYNQTSRTFSKKQLVDSTSMVMSPVDILNIDLERFPRFAKTHPLNCTIDEGDVLFMPAFWWHEVQSYPNIKQGRNLAVNFWYEPFLQKEFPCQECKLDVNPKYRHLL